MTSRIPKLVLAAVLAAALPAAAARACDHDAARRGEAAWPVPWRPDPAPPHRWREAAWRERELQRVRAEIQALDAERADFHARFAWNSSRDLLIP